MGITPTCEEVSGVGAGYEPGHGNLPYICAGMHGTVGGDNHLYFITNWLLESTLRTGMWESTLLSK